MAGIYVHIPFCRQACYYCDFHFSTNLSARQRMVDCITYEAKLMQSYLDNEVQTIYFGGGTPSLLSSLQLETILRIIYERFNLSASPEITLEANPDDINQEVLGDWKALGINRLSIGIQSFDDRLLSMMNRVHTQIQADEAIEQARKAGFENLSLDLIFAMPGQSIQDLKNDLNKIVEYGAPHVATYNLTVEPGTVFGNWLKKGKITEVSQDYAAEHYDLIMNFLNRRGYEHYEISNFALPGYRSQHNSSYWQHKPYLGLGPGAHSYNGSQRHFNIANNARYMKAIEMGNPEVTIETLSTTDRINEFILTGLRTDAGCNLDQLKQNCNFDLWQHELQILTHYLNAGYLDLNNSIIKLTRKGKFIADKITADLFQVED